VPYHEKIWEKRGAAPYILSLSTKMQGSGQFYFKSHCIQDLRDCIEELQNNFHAMQEHTLPLNDNLMILRILEYIMPYTQS